MSNVRVLQGAGTETTESPLAALLNRPAAFSQEAWHAMNARDTMQIEQEVMHGTSDASFVYAMLIKGKLVSGVSVVGARQLVTEYGGMRSQLVASTEKKGALFVFRQFRPMAIDTRVIHELESLPDYYEAVLELTDIKTGNSVEVRKAETSVGVSNSGSQYEKPHYATIAESKAFRNGVLSLIPQAVVKQFQNKCLKRALEMGAFDASESANLKAAVQKFLRTANEAPVSVEKTIDQLRDGCMAYATKHGISIDRNVLANLAYAELVGLGQASKVENGFLPAAQALGLVVEREQAPSDTPPPRRGRPAGSTNKPKSDEPKTEDPAPPVDTQTGEVGTVTFSFAVVADAINAAKDEDALNLAADLIRNVLDPNQQAELAEIAKAAKSRISDDVPY
jgi:hypothetical protein